MAKGWIGMRRSWRVRRGIATVEWLSRSRAEARQLRFRNRYDRRRFLRQRNQWVRRTVMGKGILLWLIGIPLPIIILLLLFWH